VVKRIVIIGNGIAGNSAAQTIRRFDRKVDLLLISAEGCPFYSPCAFHKFLSGEMEQHKLFLKKYESYAREGIKIILGQKVTEIDLKKREVCLFEKRIPFDALILATGAKVTVPTIKGVEKRGVFTLKIMEDAQKIFHYPAKKVVVYGSGPTGVEAAVALRKKGLKVVLLSRSRILRRLFDEEPSFMLKRALEQAGIEVLVGETIVEVLGGEAVERLATSKGELECEMLIMSSGVEPNSELTRNSGVEVGFLGGIKTDDYMMTNVENIYACGDCIESKDMITGETVMSLRWPNAKRQGWITGCNCAGGRRRFPGSFNITVIEIFGTHAVSAGVGAASAEVEKLYEVAEKKEGPIYCRLVMKDKRLVGIQLINRREHGGLLFSKMLRRDNLADLSKAVNDNHLLSIRPWNYWISQYV
jgi:NADH oxidase (H2O2-forming)